MRKVLGALLLAAVVTTLGAGSAAADPYPTSVAWTAHNLAKASTWPEGAAMERRYVTSNEEEQICKFCHTPHNAKPLQPLWNKVLPGNIGRPWEMYSSASLSATAKAVTAPGPESLLCLSCHDGVTAMNVLHNSNRRSGLIDDTGFGTDIAVDIGGEIDSIFLGPGSGKPLGDTYFGANDANLGPDRGRTNDAYYGRDLTDDHPISFSYRQAHTDKTNTQQYGLNDPTTLWNDRKLKFYGGVNVMRVECSTCHDPHVDSKTVKGAVTTSPRGNPALYPFLRMSNSNSAMCLHCHDK